MKKTIFAILGCLLISFTASGWGREGHETVAKIAENNLKPSVKKKIEKYLGGKSIVYYAKWMDDYRHTPEYGFTTGWHVNYADADGNYVHDEKSGDAIYGLEQAIGNLENYKELSDSAVAVNIKYVIHLVGDMHCPAHVKYAVHDQKYKVRIGSETMPVHTAWDDGIIKATRYFSATEWAGELDRLDARTSRAIAEGSPRDWFRDCVGTCAVQFEITRPGEQVTQDDLNIAVPLIESQILKAGLRLAELLNGLF